MVIAKFVEQARVAPDKTAIVHDGVPYSYARAGHWIVRIPAYVHIHFGTTIPRNDMGEIERRKLKEQLAYSGAGRAPSPR